MEIIDVGSNLNLIRKQRDDLADLAVLAAKYTIDPCTDSREVMISKLEELGYL